MVDFIKKFEMYAPKIPAPLCISALCSLVEKNPVKFASSLLSYEIMLNRRKTENKIRRMPSIFFVLSDEKLK